MSVAILMLALTLTAAATSVAHAASAEYTITTTGNAIVVTGVARNADPRAASEPSAGEIKGK